MCNRVAHPGCVERLWYMSRARLFTDESGVSWTVYEKQGPPSLLQHSPSGLRWLVFSAEGIRVTSVASQPLAELSDRDLEGLLDEGIRRWL